ncbi:MAG TPA: signal peptidase II [Oribacterium sp.]|nr:signal peptidase II [Oribacterium sp.]HCS68063.1 signal peptidase II [Oribacterium sp.]
MKQNMKRWSWFLLLGAVLVALDQWTKQLAVQYLMGHDQIPILPKVLYLLYIENRGAAFGSFQGAQLFFYVITVVVLCGLLYVVKRIPVKTPHFYPLLLVCELIFAGAIGNFIDRVRQQYVVDFIYFSPIDFPVFNVADIYVTTGCFLMVLLFLFYYKDEELHFLYHEKH